jgi:hypothetical protein
MILLDVATKAQWRLIVSVRCDVNEIFTKTLQIAFLPQWRCPNPAGRVPASVATV